MAGDGCGGGEAGGPHRGGQKARLPIWTFTSGSACPFRACARSEEWVYPSFGAKGSGVEWAATVGALVFRLFGEHRAFAGEGEGGVCIVIQLGCGRKEDTVL